MTDWPANPVARMYVESGSGFPVLETQNSTGGFTPANVNQIVSDVNIEFKISVEFYDHAGFPMVSALGYFSAELYKQDPNTGNEVSVDFENMYLPTDQLMVAFGVPRADLLRAGAHGSGPVAALGQADIAALRARADESLTLIDAGGDDAFQADFLAVQRRLGPGPGTLLTQAVTAASGTPGAGAAAAAAATATAWYGAHRTVRVPG